MALHERILNVLGTFDAAHPSRTLSEISRATGIPVATTHRILAELVRWGALERDGQRYVVGLRLFEIGVLSPRAYKDRDRIVPFLEELFVATREKVVLSVLHGDQAVMVEQLIGHRGPELGAGLGERLPFHAGSAGHVMLAFGPPELLDRVLAEPRTVYTDRTPVDEAELRRIVRDVRRTSVSIAEGHIVPTTASISAPVFGAEGAFVGAVSLVAEVGTVDLQALAPRVLHTARQISAALHTDPPATVRPLRRLRARRAG